MKNIEGGMVACALNCWEPEIRLVPKCWQVHRDFVSPRGQSVAKGHLGRCTQMPSPLAQDSRVATLPLTVISVTSEGAGVTVSSRGLWQLEGWGIWPGSRAGMTWGLGRVPCAKSLLTSMCLGLVFSWIRRKQGSS